MKDCRLINHVQFHLTFSIENALLYNVLHFYACLQRSYVLFYQQKQMLRR